MGIGLGRIMQVKLPVTDLQRSASWYHTALDLKLLSEFVESGVLRGAVLADRDAGFVIALRDREVSASRPHLAGFDVVAFYVPSRTALENLVERWDRLQIQHEGVQDRGPYGAVVDVPDPDGTVLRFTWPGDRIPERFTGFEFGQTGPAGTYDAPRLTGSLRTPDQVQPGELAIRAGGLLPADRTADEFQDLTRPGSMAAVPPAASVTWVLSSASDAEASTLPMNGLAPEPANRIERVQGGPSGTRRVQRRPPFRGARQVPSGRPGAAMSRSMRATTPCGVPLLSQACDLGSVG